MPGAERRGTHRRTVAPGALAAELTGNHVLPGLARADPAEHVVHRGAVASMRVVGVGSREAPGKAVLVDGAAADGEFLDKDDRLGGVVAPPPQWIRGQGPRLQGRRPVPAQDAEPLVAERVPESESVQRVQHGARHGDHRGSFAAQPRSRTPVSAQVCQGDPQAGPDAKDQVGECPSERRDAEGQRRTDARQQ